MPRRSGSGGKDLPSRIANAAPYRKPDMYFVRRDPPWCPKTGKFRYGTKIEALMTLRELDAKRTHGQPNRAEQRAYACDLCAGWHLTSKDRQVLSLGP